MNLVGIWHREKVMDATMVPGQGYVEGRPKGLEERSC